MSRLEEVLLTGVGPFQAACLLSRPCKLAHFPSALGMICVVSILKTLQILLKGGEESGTLAAAS